MHKTGPTKQFTSSKHLTQQHFTNFIFLKTTIKQFHILNNNTLKTTYIQHQTKYWSITSSTERQYGRSSSPIINKCNAMWSIMMHVWPNDTRPLSHSTGCMRNIYVHASIVVRDTSIKMVHPSYHLTLFTTMPQKQYKWYVHINNKEMIIFHNTEQFTIIQLWYNIND